VASRMSGGSNSGVAGSLVECDDKCRGGSKPEFRARSLESPHVILLRSLQQLGFGAPLKVRWRATRRKQPTTTIAETAVEGALWGQ
jgi:hypothetical protein